MCDCLVVVGIVLMKVLVSVGMLLCLLLLWVGLVLLVVVQLFGYVGQVVCCELCDMEWVYCDMFVDGGVDMVCQLLENICVCGFEWGIDCLGVWVMLGCCVEFCVCMLVMVKCVGEWLMWCVVCCEFNGCLQNCLVVLQGVLVCLLCQLLVLLCCENYSWGVCCNEIWVMCGCQGDFEVGVVDGFGFLMVL